MSLMNVMNESELKAALISFCMGWYGNYLFGWVSVGIISLVWAGISDHYLPLKQCSAEKNKHSDATWGGQRPFEAFPNDITVPYR